MNIVEKNVNEIIPYINNPRVNDNAVDKVAASIKAFGWKVPCVISKDNVIVTGHTRIKAAKKLGMETVPCIIADDLTDAQIKAFRLADNKVAEFSEWDFEKLGIEFEGLDFELEEFGFEIDFDNEEQTPEIEEDEVPEEVDTRCKLGDIWQLGEHKLICGDCTDINVIESLMGGVKADLYLTDPPYNVNYSDGHETERKIKNDNFDSDEECGRELWLPAFHNVLINSNDCCSVYCFMPQGGTHMMMMMMMMAKAGWQVKHELIWKKQSIVLNRADYNYQHEPFLYGWNKTHKFYGKGEFKNTSVWEIDRPTKSKEHPTMKPIKLLSEILLNATKEGDIVIDSFGGSGSTLIACEQLNRKCYICELDEHYCDVIIQRWENLTNQKAELIEQKD